MSRSLVNVAYQPQLSDVKTNNGRRTIDLEPKTVAVLRAWKKRQIEERMLANLRPTADLIFAHPDGSVINPDYLSQVFDRHLAKSTIPSIRLHDLRHTHASILLERRGAAQSRERAVRSCQPGIHAVRLPAPAARHASRRRQSLCRGRVRVKARNQMSHSTPATIGHDRSMEDILDRELYSEAEAARLLRLAPSTLHWWLEGGERRGRAYRPVLRVEPTGSRSVSWARVHRSGAPSPVPPRSPSALTSAPSEDRHPP